jgi:hypothetical protein
MKAIELYTNSTNEVALSMDGHWFARSYGYNGFGMGWSKWDKVEAPQYVTEIQNVYSGEVTHIESGLAIYWGFDRLSRRNSDRVRLPNK